MMNFYVRRLAGPFHRSVVDLFACCHKGRFPIYRELFMKASAEMERQRYAPSIGPPYLYKICPLVSQVTD